MPKDTLFIKINVGYRKGISPKELYDVTRGVWRISRNKTDDIKYAFAIYKNEIKELYEVEEWHEALTTEYNYRADLNENNPQLKGRLEFTGKHADETLRKCFIGKKVSQYYKRGESNPIKYLLMKDLISDFCIDKLIFPDEIQDNENLFEGAKKQITVNAYERNSQARKQCIEHYGTKCVICDFDFKKAYGEIGKNFIHVHHIKPLSEINEQYEVDPINDLKPVCPNCHAMLHKRVPAYSIEDIKNNLQI